MPSARLCLDSVQRPLLIEHPNMSVHFFSKLFQLRKMHSRRTFFSFRYRSKSGMLRSGLYKINERNIPGLLLKSDPTDCSRCLFDFFHFPFKLIPPYDTEVFLRLQSTYWCFNQLSTLYTTPSRARCVLLWKNPRNWLNYPKPWQPQKFDI